CFCLCVFQNVPQLPCGKALYSYEGKEAGDLKFSKGDIIILRRKVDENWFHGELNGSHGFLPASYIQCIRPLSQTPPQGKALYDFEVKDKDQDKDCLTFTKDEILTVIRRVDDNWAEGMLGDKIGIFPILYVELNETAKQLMEMDKPSAAPGPSAESPAAVSCNGNAVHRHAEGKKNAKKRHSFTALSVTQRSAQVLGNNRHSMEISAPVLISSSDPRAAARIADCPHLSSSAPATQLIKSPHTHTHTHTHTLPQEHASLMNLSLHLCRYLAMYAYKPQKADELELRKGEMYRVMEKCQDGWFKGTSLRSGASGVFPGNYVTPVSSPPVSSSPERPTASVTPLRPQASPSRSPARPLSMTAAPQPHAASVRPLRPLSSITPPNASAAHLNAADLHKLQDKKLEKVSAETITDMSGSVCVCDSVCLSQKEKKSSGLLKLLSGAAAKKKSRSPPSVSPTHESSSSSSSCSVQGAMAPELRSAGGHGRAGSCPIESEMQGAMSMDGSLDLSFSVSPPARQPCSSSPLAIRPEPKPLSRERYRVLVPYPPQSEAEIELKEGDIVFVHKKREDGWYKGTLQRTGRTGLFPGSFVESF
uniref:RING-type E3 ubiquitin transferase n=1 Tax=Sinocyclocheilus rhinocerous TaxID=307959 RepID=A0A673MUM6_9TELE